ncbi:hypothetical protein [Sporosarcina sp. HYO08]|uniref:hypothetical protein n=1 Tax=Sporosarcina sp. HYO08 TaxID=1759557 RepID=UPI0007934AF3|nr:hypothetical protein [Sporosarcina sp. HYO08]KXH87430.1 hypothetical protein AU377_02340 [Sporosarcina sp. HYO08]
MRIFILAIVLFILIHFVRMDFAEGTIPLASFTKQPIPCNETEEMPSITVTTIPGDTIESLFAMYPDPELNFMERLSAFYKLNPHVQNQTIIGGQQLYIPLSRHTTEQCKP